MSDSLTKEQADRVKQLKAELASLEAKGAKPRKSKEQRQRDECAERLAGFDNGELALCKKIGAEKSVELSTKALQASAAKLDASNLVMLYGTEDGKLFAKAKTHWYGIAMGDL